VTGPTRSATSSPRQKVRQHDPGIDEGRAGSGHSVWLGLDPGELSPTWQRSSG